MIVMDIVRKDESNENEVKSDCVQILIDLIAYFEQLNTELNNVNWNKVQLVRSSTVEMFTESRLIFCNTFITIPNIQNISKYQFFLQCF